MIQSDFISKSGKCLLINLHLLACPDVGTCVFHSIFPLLPSRGCREGMRKGCSMWRKHLYLEGFAVAETQSTLVELCCERCTVECWLSTARFRSYLPWSLKTHITEGGTGSVELGRGTKVRKSWVKERTSALTLTTLSLDLFLVVDLQVGLNVKYSLLDSPDLVFLVTLF